VENCVYSYVLTIRSLLLLVYEQVFADFNGTRRTKKFNNFLRESRHCHPEKLITADKKPTTIS